MGNICKGQDGGTDNGRKPSSQRNGSGSTSNFSPNEGYSLADNPGVGAGTRAVQSQEARAGVPLSGQEKGSALNRAAAAAEVDVQVPGAHVDRSRTDGRSTHSANGVDAVVDQSQRDSAGSGEGDSGGDQSEKSERKVRHRDPIGKDDERSSRRKDKDGQRSRSSKGGGTSKSRKKSGRRDSERGSEGDPGGRRPRSELSEKEIAERREKRAREKRERANGEPETDEARRQRREKKERKERRKRKEAEAAASASATGRTEVESNGERTGGIAGPHGSPDRTREPKSNRNETETSAGVRKNSSREGGDGSAPRERGSGSHGASGVMAGSGASATGGSIAAVDVDRKSKKGSSLRKMYDSLTGQFSASVAQNSATGAPVVGGGAGGGGGGGGGGPAGGGPAGGGGGGGTSSGRGSSKASRPSGRGQLVTSMTSRDVREKYEIERSQLGHGHYGVVRRCWNKKTREGFAIKTIKKSKVSRIESLRREIDILRCVDHPCIIKLYDVYEDERFIHLVTELCTGGELFDRIIQKTESDEGHYSEKDAKVVVASILSGIEYCHNKHNICHRDLKPENFLFKRPDCDTEIKIIDFGLSRFEDMQSAMTTRVGTPYYIAPEVLSRKYDKACDLWSIGVITYILLAGYPPFYGESDQEIFASVRHGYFDFPSPEWDSISREAKDFITQLLQKDPSARMTATQAISHGWFDTPPGRRAAMAGVAGAGDGAGAVTVQEKRDKMNNEVSMQRINHRLRRFVGMSKLKKVALNVIAQQLTEADIGHLRGVFERLDVEGNGLISVNELEQVVKQEGLECMQEDVIRLLQGIDIDGSNSLNYREFLAATMERNIFIREKNVRCAFDYFDLDGKSEITLANLVKIFGAEEHAREIMGDVNLSGEGVISYEEFKNMMTEMPLDGRDPLTPRTPRTPFTVRT